MDSSRSKAREFDGSARCASPLWMLSSVWCYYCRVKGSNSTSTILWQPNLWPTHIFDSTWFHVQKMVLWFHVYKMALYQCNIEYGKEWPILAGKVYEIFGAVCLRSQDSGLMFSLPPQKEFWNSISFGIRFCPLILFWSLSSQSNSSALHRDSLFSPTLLSLVSAYTRTLGVLKLYSFSPPRSLTLAE